MDAQRQNPRAWGLATIQTSSGLRKVLQSDGWASPGRVHPPTGSLHAAKSLSRTTPRPRAPFRISDPLALSGRKPLILGNAAAWAVRAVRGVWLRPSFVHARRKLLARMTKTATGSCQQCISGFWVRTAVGRALCLPEDWLDTRPSGKPAQQSPQHGPDMRPQRHAG